LQDTVFGDAVEERFIQARVFAHIVLDGEVVRIQVLNGAQRGLGSLRVSWVIMSRGASSPTALRVIAFPIRLLRTLEASGLYPRPLAMSTVRTVRSQHPVQAGDCGIKSNHV